MPRLVVASTELAAGRLTRRDLRRGYDKVFQNVYARRGVALTARDRAVAGWLWAGGEATVAGLSAAALLGSRWIPDDTGPELIRTQPRAPAGVLVRTDTLRDDEVCVLDGIACTTTARTAYDLGRRLSPTEAVIRIDALLNATGVPVTAVAALARRYPGARGVRRLRSALSLADAGAESPQETRLRLLLIRGGLPRPQTQIPIRNRWGKVVRRVDLGWEHCRVGVEYDGPQHWTDPGQHAGDIDRLEFLAGRGWRIVRVSAAHLRADPWGTVARAREALRAAGWAP